MRASACGRARGCLRQRRVATACSQGTWHLACACAWMTPPLTASSWAHSHSQPHPLPFNAWQFAQTALRSAARPDPSLPVAEPIRTRSAPRLYPTAEDLLSSDEPSSDAEGDDQPVGWGVDADGSGAGLNAPSASGGGGGGHDDVDSVFMTCPPATALRPSRTEPAQVGVSAAHSTASPVGPPHTGPGPVRTGPARGSNVSFERPPSGGPSHLPSRNPSRPPSGGSVRSCGPGLRAASPRSLASPLRAPSRSPSASSTPSRPQSASSRAGSSRAGSRPGSAGLPPRLAGTWIDAEAAAEQLSHPIVRKVRAACSGHCATARGHAHRRPCCCAFRVRIPRTARRHAHAHARTAAPTTPTAAAPNALGQMHMHMHAGMHMHTRPPPPHPMPLSRWDCSAPSADGQIS